MTNSSTDKLWIGWTIIGNRLTHYADQRYFGRLYRMIVLRQAGFLTCFLFVSTNIVNSEKSEVRAWVANYQAITAYSMTSSFSKLSAIIAELLHKRCSIDQCVLHQYQLRLPSGGSCIEGERKRPPLRLCNHTHLVAG